MREGDSENLSKEITDFEPKAALFSGDDGLNFHKRIVKECKTYLKSGGLLALEVGLGDDERLIELIESDRSFQKTKIIKDLAGIKRIVNALKL